MIVVKSGFNVKFFFENFLNFFLLKRIKMKFTRRKFTPNQPTTPNFKLPLNLKPAQTHYVVVSGKYHQAQKQRHTSVA